MKARGGAAVLAWARRPVRIGVVAVAALAAVLTALVGVRAIGSDPTRCERFATAADARAAVVTGSGARVLVIGDSWAAGLGLERPELSWPTRLPGQVHVDGFSGSGFSAHASGCGRAVSFARRAPGSLSGGLGGSLRGADLVVVEGGLNDVDRPAAEIRSGFRRLMRTLEGYDVVVVGPATAPARAHAVPRVDALLARLAAAHEVPYVRTSGLRLSYLPDRLHLTPAGHQAFGDHVAAQLAARGLG